MKMSYYDTELVSENDTLCYEWRKVQLGVALYTPYQHIMNWIFNVITIPMCTFLGIWGGLLRSVGNQATGGPAFG